MLFFSDFGSIDGKQQTFILQTEGNGYHGLISEDSTVVNVTPPIKAVGELVCGFSILNHHHRADLPFDVSFVIAEQGFPTKVPRYTRVPEAGARGVTNSYNYLIFIPTKAAGGEAKYLVY